MQEDPFAPLPQQEDPFAPLPTKQPANVDMFMATRSGASDPVEPNPYVPQFGISSPLGERTLERQRALEPLVQQIEQSGGVPKSVQWAAGHMSGGQTDSPYDQQYPGANAADIGLEWSKGNLAIGPLARTLVGTLPFVPAREASQEAKDIAEATQIVMARQAETSNADRATQALGNMTGFLGNMYGPGLVANATIKGASALSKAGRMAAPMSLTMAAPALEAGEFKDAAVAGAKGAALGVALGGATRLAEKLPGSVTPWIARPVAQTAVLTGNKVLETGELPDKRDLAIDLAFNAATQGVPQRLVPEAMRRSAPKVDEPLSSKLRPPSEATRAKYPQQATGARDPAVGAILSPEKALPPEPKPVEPASSPIAGDAVQITASPDISYESMRTGAKPLYAMPKDKLLTASEKAHAESKFADPDVTVIETDSNVYSFKPKYLKKFLESKDNDSKNLIVRSPQGIDFEATLRNFESADRLGAPLGYGVGNASKVGATHAVTGRAADGSEITTILAKNVAGAEKALRDQGAVTVEVKLIDSGVSEIITERGGLKQGSKESEVLRKAMLSDAQRKADAALLEKQRHEEVLSKLYPGGKWVKQKPDGSTRSVGLPPKPWVKTGEGVSPEQFARGQDVPRPEPPVEPQQKPLEGTTSPTRVYGARGEPAKPTSPPPEPTSDPTEVYGPGGGKVDWHKKNRPENKVPTKVRGVGGKSSSREGGFIDLSILTGKKKSQAQKQADQEIETVSEKRKAFQIQHADVASQDDPLFIAGTKAMASQNAATRKAGVFAEDLWNSLGHDPKMVDLWTRYVVHQNAKAEQAKGKDISPHLFMPHDEYLTVRENRELFNEAERVTREFSDAMSEHKDIVGIKGTRSVEDVPYFRLASIHTPELRQAAGARAARAKLPTGYLESAEFAEGTAEPSARGVGGIGPYNRGMSRKSGSAKTATGQSDTYAVEPFTMAMEMLRSHELPARHNQFLNEVRSKAIPESDAKDAKFQTIYNGKKVKLVKVNVAKRPDWMPDESVPELADEAAKATESKKAEENLYVPEPVAKFWEDYTAPGAHDPPSKLNKLAQWPTKLSLATTVGDSTVQVMHGLSVASRISGYGKGVWQKAVQRYGGIGRFLGAIQSVEDFNSPDAKRWHKLLTETGALRPQEMGPQSESNSWSEPEKWLETFAPPLHKLTTTVFDVGGVMDKQRVSWAQALKKTNPELSDAQIVWTVQNLGGSFVKAMQPKVVQDMPRVVAPFVQMGTTKARNALQQVAGRKPEAAVLGPSERKWSAEQLTRYPWAKATSIGAAWLLGNALSDDDETLEESLQHVGYAKIDGRLYPIAKFLDPTTEATSRLLGVNNAISSAALGESPTEIAQNALRSPLNYVGGYVGPVPTAAMIATSDKLPFFGRNLYPIRAFPKSDDANPIAQRATAVGSALLPGVEDQFTTSPDDATMSLRRKALERLLNLGGIKSRPYQEPKR